MRDGVGEAKRYLENAIRALDGFSRATTASDLRDEWEGFLGHFARALGRTIAIGLADPNTRASAHRLKNVSNGGDEGLTFLREARNSIEHGLEPVAHFFDPYVDVAGFAALAGDSTISFVNCTFNGRPICDFMLAAKEGRVSTVEGNPQIPIEEVGPGVQLVPVTNSEKRLTVPVPVSLMGRPLENQSAMCLGRVAIDFLCDELEKSSH